MAYSVRPLVEGQYGADFTCPMALNFMNDLNSSLIKSVPLSETTSGIP